MALKFLIVNAYDPDGQAALDASGCTDPALLYQDMLADLMPGAESHILRPAYTNAALPNGHALGSFDGVIWTGSSLTIHKPDRYVTPQIDLTREIFKSRVPQFGSCWACQIAVVAAGGQCAASPLGREAGLARKVMLNEAGRAHPMFAGKAAVFDAYTNHSDEVIHLPSGAVLLAGNGHSRVQAVDVSFDGGRFWAVQYHPEYNLRELANLTKARKDMLIGFGKFRDHADADAFISDLETLNGDTGRQDIAWRLGIDGDVLNTDSRRREVRNWLNFVAAGGR